MKTTLYREEITQRRRDAEAQRGERGVSFFSTFFPLSSTSSTSSPSSPRSPRLRASARVFSGFIILLALLACENPIEMPFKAGLGPVEDTRPPTVSLESHKPGASLFGKELFSGSAEDDYKLDRVEFLVTERPGLREGKTEENHPVSLNLRKQNTGTWSVSFDTTIYRDGDMKIRLRVWDSYNKSAVTDEIAFYIRNEPTLIELTAPYIKPGTSRGDVGGELLNDGTKDELKKPGMNYKHKVPKGDSITGAIKHEDGIYTGAESGGRYPPQIRFWRVNDMTDPSDTDGYMPGVLPGVGEVPWHTLVPNKELISVGIGSYIFNYAFPKNKDNTDAKTDCYYGFEIRAQNDDGRSSVNYPRSYYPDDEWDKPGAEYYRYVLVYYSPDNETPVVTLYGLEDVNDYWAHGSVSTTYPYQTLKNAGGGPLTDDEAHPYVNNLTADKNGEFILRIRASHSEGIGAAEVYWENKDDSSQRGRFIWDFEADPVNSGMPNQNISEERWDLNVSNPYYQWGYKEPFAPYLTSGRRSRSFFFHYRHNGAYRIPVSGGGGLNNVWTGANRTQVQRYAGSAGDWEAGKKDGRFGRSNDTGVWQNMTTTLPDGNYKLEVYARTPSLSSVEKALLELNLRLDTQAPVVTFNQVYKVEGTSVYGKKSGTGTGTVPAEYIVNGVVQPTLSFKDPPDARGSGGSNPRLASTGNYFKNAAATLDYEQFFILVGDAGRAALEGKISKTWWPVDNAATAGAVGSTGLISGEVTGIPDIKRNGPVFNGVFKVKTSPIYSFPPSYPPSGTDADGLADGKYWVYVFCRDNAFNVGYEKIALDVQKDTDIPILDFSVGAIRKVTDPNQSADNTAAGFVYDGGVRNKLAGGSSIRLTIKDDDSLDLGIDGGADSGVTITFTGSYTDTEGKIQALADQSAVYQLSLTPSQIKGVFTPWSSAATVQAVTSRMGEIGQAALLDRLKANTNYDDIFPSYGTSLPDGMYRFTIAIKDYPALKMRMDTPTTPPTAASASETFWVVVDSKAPEYEVYSNPALSAQPDQYLQEGTIAGNVWDKNGPIKILGYSKSPANSQTSQTEANKINFSAALGSRDTADANNWKYPFTAPVNMNGASGDFRFEITFEDRFGNTSTLSQILHVDGVKPTAAIGTRITTFERNYADVTNGGSDIGETNRLRLANGVLNFIISANDNIKVTGVKWWLVPAGTPGPVSADKTSYDNYTAGKSGVLDGTAGKEFNAMQFIDTKTPPELNGEYTLYVMAIDSAGNVSEITDTNNSKQTIYLLQEQDKPYFGYWDGTGSPPITPAALNLAGTDLMVTDDATLRGSIYDDDGFDDGAVPVPVVVSESVRIWVSSMATAGNVDVNSDTSLGTYDFGTAMTFNPAGGDNTFTTGLSRLRKGVVSMNINLKTLFPAAMATDGIKYYIIEAKDNSYGKYTGTGGAGTERVVRRKLFSFIYDTTAPVITLTAEATGGGMKNFGPNADDNDASDSVKFFLEGDISDANLKQIADPDNPGDSALYYYFDYYLDSGTRKTFILKPEPGVITVSPTTPTTDVHFWISAARFCQEINFMDNTAVTPDVTHTLTLTVQDKSGKVNKTSCSFNFVKDVTPPSLTITDPANTKRLPRRPFPVSGMGTGPEDWWATSWDGANLQQLYQLKRTWEKTNALPIIDYNTGVPRLKVNFADITSTISAEAGAFKYWIDDQSASRTAVIPPGSKSVSLTLDLTTTNGGSTPLADGIHSIRFEIQDSVGNKLEASDANGNIYYGFRINSGPPVIKAETPATGNVYGNVSGAALFTLNVEAKGPNLKDAQMRIRYPGQNTYTSIALSPDPAATDANWSFVSPDEVLQWSQNILRTNLGSVLEGDYELELTARGRDNKASDPPWLWTFTYDNSPPTLALDDWAAIAAATNVTPAYWKTNTGKKVFNSLSQRIQGRISDQYSNLKNAQILIEKYDYTSGAWGKSYYDTGSGSWNTAETWNELLQADESTREKRVDLTLGAIADISDGLYRVRLRAKDSAYISGSAAWTPATVDGHPAYSNYYYFFYAPTTPTISFADDDAPVTLYSAKVSNGTLSFAGNATSGNGYEKLEVKVEKGSVTQSITLTLASPVPGAAPWSPEWNWTANLAGFLQTTAGDGSYRLTFTVTDLAGNSAAKSRTITLDNTPPTGKFTAPELLPASVRADARYANGSETFYGGEDALITGTAEDTYDVAGIWYHLGYTQNGVAGTALAFPTEAQIIQSALGTATDAGGKANNDKFDELASASSGEAWFKYASGYTQADGFVIPPSVILEDWRMEISSITDLSKTYAKTNLTLKGITYNAAHSSGYGAGRRMAQKIDESGLSSSYRKNGLYSLPLWVRVADKAGNVSYFKQDIWLYPNGDYPANGITNPSPRTSDQNASKGGTVSFDGVASDNVNVKSVIYRVRADNMPSTNANYTTQAPPMAQLIRPTSPEARPLAAGAQMTLLTSGTGINGEGWYMASLEGEFSIAKTKAWSFYVNADNEFTTNQASLSNQSPLQAWGFKSSASLANNDMIRVYVEVLVFDGDSATNDYHLMSLGDNPGDPPVAAPHVVVFYLSSTSPTISAQKLSDVGAFDGTAAPNNAAYVDYTAGKTRSRRFSVRMQFDSGSTLKNISRVQVRLPSETGADGDNSLLSWRDAWNSTWPANGTNNPRGVTFATVAAPTVTVNPAQASRSFVMHYGFDTAATAAAGFQQVMKGNWAAKGGKYVIEVRLLDNSTPNVMETSYKFEVGIDNFAPIADTTKIISNTKVAGTNQQFMGRAYDYEGLTNSSSPSPGYYSIEKVYAWFTKNADGEHGYVNMSTKADPVDSVTTDSKPGVKGRSASGLDADPVTNITSVTAGTSGNYSYPRPGTRTENGETVEVSNQYVKVITESQAAQFDNNMNWQPITAGRSVLWSFMADTTVMPDGWVYLNYLVVDCAGNASLYQQKMVVMNNYPFITDLTLYTNNSGEGAVFTTHDTDDASSDYKVPASPDKDGYLNTGFISKNKYIGFRVQTAKGNPPLNYRVQPVTRDRVELTSGNLTSIASDVNGSRTYSTIYTIAAKGTMGDAIWATLMDEPSVTAVEGKHFTFRAKAADVAGMNFPGTYVYRYKPIGTLSREKTGLSGTYVDDKDYSGESYGGGFRFEGADFGTAATTITEKMKSRPDSPADNDTTANRDNTALFLIKVWDTVIKSGEENFSEDSQLYDALVVGMNVWLTDSTNPTARLYDLNPYTEIAVVGNNIGETNQNRTIRNAADPRAVGSNIVRGGLFNTKLVKDLVKSGYIDPRDGSKALTPMNSSGVPGSDGIPVPDSDYPLKVSSDSVNTGTGARDQVSGRIILRGLAWDDQLIDQIQISIGGVTNTILQLGDSEETNDEGQTVTVRRMMPVGGNLAFAAETLHWQTGHTVEWAYVWDTEKLPSGRTGGGPRSDVAVKVIVIDKKGPRTSPDVTLAAETGDSTGKTFHNTVNVDIVPYITGFERETPTFTTKRSLQGWYSFYQGESNIALLGYNFGQSGVSVYLNSGSETTISATYNASTNTAVPANVRGRLSFAIPATAASGKLDAGTSSTRAYNHTSNHDRSWNKEYNSNTPGSTLWINRPHAHIWRSVQSSDAPRTYIGSIDGSTGLDHPGMALEYVGTNTGAGTGAGTLHGTWAVYGKANSYYGTNGPANNYYALHSGTPGEPFCTPDISIFQGGGSANANVGYTYQTDGRPRILGRAILTTAAGNNTYNDFVVQDYGANGSNERWQNIRISKAAGNGSTTLATNNVGLIYMTAFNGDTKGLWYGARNATTNTTMFIDGTGGLGITNITAGGIAAAANAGEFSAVDYDNVGPIIAYYDQTNDTVRIAFGANTNPTAAGSQWTRRYLLPESGTGSQLRRGSGKYISMKVDSANGIHLAFYNSTYQTVVYYYAANRSYINVASPPVHNADTVKIHTVDNVVTGGTWTDISVEEDNGIRPWIVYGDSQRTGNYDGVRVAYLSSSNDTVNFLNRFLTCPVVTNINITGWEAVSMPAAYKVNADRLNIEAWPPAIRGGSRGTRASTDTWNAAIGYASDMYRVGYFYKPGYKGY